MWFWDWLNRKIWITPESKTAREEALEMYKAQLDAEAIEITEQIQQDTDTAIAGNQAKYNTEIQTEYVTACNEAKEYMEQEFVRILWVINSLWVEKIDMSDDNHWAGEFWKGLIEHRNKDVFNRISFDIQLFTTSIGNKLEVVRIYGKVPQDIINDIEKKESQLNQSLQTKKEELLMNWETPTRPSFSERTERFWETDES